MAKRKYTKKLLGPIVKKNNSISKVLEELNLKKTGGNYRNIQKWIRYYELSTSHFKGQGWAKGESKETHKSIKNQSLKARTPDKEVFSSNSRYASSSKVAKRYLEKTGVEYKCSNCELNDWLGEPITLHLDHINGIHNDNRIENLRLLCPNCHQQTKTWGKRKTK